MDTEEAANPSRKVSQSPQPRPNKTRLDNRWGCAVGHAFRSFNPPSRFDAHPRPSGASA